MQSDDLQQFKNKLKKITFKNNFETYTSLAFYLHIRNISSFGKCLVVGRDMSLLQPLIDHMQYDLNDTSNIDFCNLGNKDLPKKDDINYLRLEQINALNKKNFIVIGADNFQTIFRVLLITLPTLEVGGQMHLTLPTMWEQYMFSMMHEIFNLFETHESYGATYVCQEDRTLSDDMCAMTGFRGLTQNVLKLLTKLDGLGDTSIDCIGCNNNGTAEYRNWIAQKIDRQIASLLEFENTVKNITVGEVIMKFKMEYMSSIKIAKKLGLEVAEWATNENYFKDIVTLLELTHVSGLLSHKKYDIDDKHSDITKKKKELFWLSESVYQYVEKVDSKKYSSTELYFNNLYKNLNRSLATEYNITINGQYVSRA